ncbi:PREDICTED: calmodulin-binding protein 25 [Theobroma cacao]|uniref:Calmodulin-binding protein 25 n=1 Tax=Theobroma cacao TaxID=3641 RepID=A0AB32WAY7_THECC|nr:PREDICTED: calmodulin-binding protein 25 [Theobroma cacao]
MASSENLASIEPWTFRPRFADSWISEAFARDTETLTRALEKSISNSFTNPDSLSPLLNLINPNTPPTPTPTPTSTSTPAPTPTPSASNVSGSDPETAPKRKRTTIPPPTATGKVSKRKPRACKRSQTTFITADPANFRQMVQQVTGVRFGNAQMSLGPILKPEPQRPGSRLPNGAGPGCLPTLDTSAFLLDHQQQSSGAVVGSSLLPFQSSVVAEGVASAGATLDCDTFTSFPTLESWKV